MAHVCAELRCRAGSCAQLHHHLGGTRAQGPLAVITGGSSRGHQNTPWLSRNCLLEPVGKQQRQRTTVQTCFEHQMHTFTKRSWINKSQDSTTNPIHTGLLTSSCSVPQLHINTVYRQPHMALATSMPTSNIPIAGMRLVASTWCRRSCTSSV